MTIVCHLVLLSFGQNVWLGLMKPQDPPLSQDWEQRHSEPGTESNVAHLSEFKDLESPEDMRKEINAWMERGCWPMDWVPHKWFDFLSSQNQPGDGFSFVLAGANLGACFQHRCSQVHLLFDSIRNRYLLVYRCQIKPAP